MRRIWRSAAKPFVAFGRWSARLWRKCAPVCIKLLHPPIWLLMLLVAACTGLLAAVFINGWDEHPLAVAAYVLSFYTLTALTLVMIKVIPRWYRAVKGKVYANQFGNRYMTDVKFKTHVSLYRSLGVNLLYVMINLVSGIWYRSYWFYVLAGYYSILSLMRFLLLRYVNRNTIGESRVAELRRARLCAVLLLFVNLTLTGAVMMMMYQDRGWKYNGILIYVMAAYTFYITISAIRNLIKYRKYRSPILSMTKVINMAAALVSMLSLETAMLAQFAVAESQKFRRIMIASTGAGVSAIVVAMSVYMIVRAGREITKETENG